ncbi:hypothetical protein DDZ14_16865 [Maritimibacter sp. 55A14]|uniref:hypothetical protein n=1 Tax=Maritimibacter sp. 55A14 TaxID=2174844 RepID=UPI000D607EDA|nr:hypothetical protein [Maritimibacter sp. 55A14]PWE29897.1 hypothetical protein DDZ14_16865 [Maritimibacter sp. 55A14]
MIIGQEATRIAKDIQIDLQAGRRVKDIGDANRIAFLSAELTSELLADDHPDAIFAFTVRLGPERLGKHIDCDGNLDSHALRKELARTLKRNLQRDADEEIVGLHWNVLEARIRDGGEADPCLRGMAVFPPEYEARVQSAFQSFGTFRSPPNQAVRFELINTPPDALRWAVHAMNVGGKSYRTREAVKCTSTLWSAACRRVSGTSDPWIAGLQPPVSVSQMPMPASKSCDAVTCPTRRSKMSREARMPVPFGPEP